MHYEYVTSMTNHDAKKRRPFADIRGLLLFIILLPLIVVVAVVRLLYGLLLYIAVWCCWCTRGRFALVVYSESPVWHSYIQEAILPQLRGRAVILNWSERRKWQRTLAVCVFQYFGGYREFNPLAVVFPPFKRARIFRFYEPFREFKEGKPDAVMKMRTELLAVLDRIASPRRP